MEEIFAPYSLSLELKNLGFNEPCITYWFFKPIMEVGVLYPNSQPGSGFSIKGFKNSYAKFCKEDCTAPTWEQVFDWFRREMGLSGSLITNMNSGMEVSCFSIHELKNCKQPSKFYEYYISGKFVSRDIARVELIKKMISWKK